MFMLDIKKIIKILKSHIMISRYITGSEIN